MDLSGKVALVTGSGQGLGLAYAKALALAGADVVVNDLQPEAVERSVKEIEALGGRARGLAARVGETSSAEALVSFTVEAFGKIDVLVTNAGILRDRVLWNMTDEDFDDVIRVHLRGTFTCARAAVTAMRRQGTGGRLILIASPAGQRGNFGQTNYASAKAGVVAMARTWAMELARSDITANAVIPIAATEMTKTIPAFAAAIEESERTGDPLPNWLRSGEGLGTPQDAAGLIVFLSSDDASSVTGQAIGIGGDKIALWSHPREIATSYRDGGWSSAAISQAWLAGIGRQPETYGIPAPTTRAK